MRWSAANRLRPTLWDGVVVLAVLAAAFAVFFSFFPQGEAVASVQIVLNHALVAEYPLSGRSEPLLLEVPGARYPITLELQEGRVRVLHSDCPSQDCVHTGWVSRAGGQIVCLPNRMVVSVLGGAASEVDGITG